MAAQSDKALIAALACTLAGVAGVVVAQPGSDPSPNQVAEELSNEAEDEVLSTEALVETARENGVPEINREGFREMAREAEVRANEREERCRETEGASGD